MNGLTGWVNVAINALILGVGLWGVRRKVEKTHALLSIEKRALLNEILTLKQEILTLKLTILEK